MTKQQKIYIKGYAEKHLRITITFEDKTTKTRYLCYSEIKDVIDGNKMEIRGVEYLVDRNNIDKEELSHYLPLLVDYINDKPALHIKRVDLQQVHWRKYCYIWLRQQLYNPEIKNKKKFLKYLLNLIKKERYSTEQEFLTHNHNRSYISYSVFNEEYIEYLIKNYKYYYIFI